MTVTWLHISDLHCMGGDDWGRDVVTRALFDAVAAETKKKTGRRADLIFFTGDVVGKGDKAGYAGASAFFDALLAAAGLDRSRLFVVPGNHDVDRNAGQSLIRTLESEADADYFCERVRPDDHLKQRMAAFAAWYDGYFAGIRRFPTDSTCFEAEAVEIGGRRIGVLPINTATFCRGDDDQRKLFVGRKCLDGGLRRLQALDADLRVALMHHPVDWLSDLERSTVRAALQGAVDMVLTGHLHESEVAQVATADGRVLQLGAGAAYQTETYPNLALWGRWTGKRATIAPIRYFKTPRPVWTTNSSLFPDEPRHEKSWPLAARTRAAPQAADGSGDATEPGGGTAKAPIDGAVKAPAAAPPGEPVRSREKLRDRLAILPRAAAQILAARAALRVMPLLAGLRPRDERPWSTVLPPHLCGMAAPWAAAKYPTHGAEVAAASATARAASAAAFATATATAAAFAAATATADAAAATATAAAAAAADAAADAADDAAYAARAAIWTEISNDLIALEKRGTPVAAVSEAALWRSGQPTWFAAAWQRFRDDLTERPKSENWWVWLDWLEARVEGRPGDEDEDLARVVLREATWRSSAKEINADIAARLVEIRRERAAKVPPKPEQQHGQTFRVAQLGLQVETVFHPQRCDDWTKRLHNLLRTRANDVRLSLGPVGNQFADLSRLLDTYAVALEPEFSDLDLFTVWHTGVSLIEMTDAFRSEASSPATLGTEQKGLLQALAAFHIQFVKRLPELTAQTEVSDIDLRSAAELDSIVPSMTRLLRRIGLMERGVESKTKRLFDAVAIGKEAAAGGFPEGVRSAYIILSDALIAISDHIDRLEQGVPAGSDGFLKGVGETDPEDTKALVRLFRDQEKDIRTFSQPFSNLGIWIDWVYMRMGSLRGI